MKIVKRIVAYVLHKLMLVVLIVGGVIVGLIMFTLIGGMGLALMGTAIGIGPVGWIGLGTVVALAGYGSFVGIRNTVRGIRG